MTNLFGHQPTPPPAEPSAAGSLSHERHSAPPRSTPPPFTVISALAGEGPRPRRRPGDGFTPTVAAVVMLNEDPWRRRDRRPDPDDPDR